MVRFKNRYLLLQLHFPSPPLPTSSSSTLTSSALLSSIRFSIQSLFGYLGSGFLLQSVQVKYYSPHTNVAIVRVDRDYFRALWSAINFITDVDGRECAVQVVWVGGTIKQIQKAAIRHDTEQLLLLECKLREQGKPIPLIKFESYVAICVSYRTGALQTSRFSKRGC
ncbi:hypothetical protein BKA69DRAFT_251434 [Paraphysoderma sedebokerense]|nr:hypothetical protein BKA69DRAFT_251434 [Paraphysoderma sedebokerense]